MVILLSNFFQFCGSTIAGLSLLSDSIMRLVKEDTPSEWLDLLLSRRSLYILRCCICLISVLMFPKYDVFEILINTQGWMVIVKKQLWQFAINKGSPCPFYTCAGTRPDISSLMRSWKMRSLCSTGRECLDSDAFLSSVVTFQDKL